MSKGEDKIINILKQSGTFFEREKSFFDLHKNKYRFDFYIPYLFSAPVLLEIDGEQHFRQITKFHKSRSDFLAGCERDRLKNSYALAHKIPLYRIPFYDIPTLQTLDDLFKREFLVQSKWHNDNIRNNLPK